jgi:hypothetical protein
MLCNIGDLDNSPCTAWGLEIVPTIFEANIYNKLILMGSPCSLDCFRNCVHGATLFFWLRHTGSQMAKFLSII